jgi:hypothetical protein
MCHSEREGWSMRCKLNDIRRFDIDSIMHSPCIRVTLPCSFGRAPVPFASERSLLPPPSSSDPSASPASPATSFVLFRKLDPARVAQLVGKYGGDVKESLRELNMPEPTSMSTGGKKHPSSKNDPKSSSKASAGSKETNPKPKMERQAAPKAAADAAAVSPVAVSPSGLK